MEIDITPAQLNAIKGLADEASAFRDGLAANDKESARYIRLIDKMLSDNNLPPRSFK